MNKKLLALLFIPFLLLSCGGNPASTSGGGSGSSGESSGSSGGGSGGNEYDKWCNSWSKPGHCYIHYNRGAGKTDYGNYCLWFWQHSPEDLEGSLWAFSRESTKVGDTELHPMSRTWMTGKDVGNTGDEWFIDDYGAIVDVDLYNSNLVDGKYGKAENCSYVGAQEVGFLMVQQESMTGLTHWTSDGGKNTYIDEFGDEANWRQVTGGTAIHIFIASGALNDYSFYQGDGIPEAKENPIDKDTEKKYRSETTEVTTVSNNSKTSSIFKNPEEAGVGYQIFVSSFRDSNGDGIGDIRGIIDALDYLEDLGIDVLWLTPIQKSDSYHGYDISDYYAVDKRFGTLEDYQELIYACHKRGMKVLMDLVLNHTSKNNVWFTKSQWGYNSGDGLPTDDTGIKWRNIYTWKYETDTFKTRYGVVETDASGNKTYVYKGYRPDSYTILDDSLDQNGPSWYRDGESHYYYYGKFGSGMPELNYDNQQTRDLVCDMAKYWLSFGLDGFRLDAVKHIYMEDECETASGDIILTDCGYTTVYDDEKGKEVDKIMNYTQNVTKNVNWWKYFANELKTVYPDCFLVGENFEGNGKVIAPYYQGLDSQFDFSNYYHSVAWLYSAGGASNYASSTTGQASETFDVFRGSGTSVVTDKIDGDKYIPQGQRNDFINGAYTSNHDIMRCLNHSAGEVVSKMQSNDATNLKYSDDNEQAIGRAKVAAALAILNPGTSWIYYGDELGMSSNTSQHKTLYGNNNSIDIWYRQPFMWQDESVRTSYKTGKYQIEYDAYNLGMLNAGKGINYEPVSGGETYNVSTTNEMYSWYKQLIDIKHQYPTNAAVSFEYSSENVLLMDIYDSNGARKLRIFINTGYNGNEYLIWDDKGMSVYKSLVPGGSMSIGGNIGDWNNRYGLVALKA